MAAMRDNPLRKFIASPFVAGLLVATCVFALCVDDAEAQRRGGGGGSRGGGGGGHGGRMAQSSVSGGNRGGGRSAAGGGSSRGGSSSGRSADRGGGGGRSADRGNSGGRSGDRSSERTRTSGDRTTNIGSNNNINVDRGDVNIDIDGGYNGCCRARYPIAAGVTIGAIAGATAAAVGSYYYALPATGCAMVTRGGVGYYQCGSAYYQQSMNGDQVVYVSVNP